MTPSLNKYY